MSASARGDRLGQWWWAAAVWALLAVASCRPSADQASETIARARTSADTVVPVAGQDRAPAAGGDAAEDSEVPDVGAEVGSPRLGERVMQSEAAAGQGLVEQYFPLRPDASWHYRLRVTDGDGKLVAESTLAKTIRGTRELGGKQYWRVETETLSGQDAGALPQHYRVTPAGVVAAVAGAPGKELLVFPSAPDSNQSWTDTAPPAIKRVVAKVSTDQEVPSGAGNYSSCIYVDLDMVMPGSGLFSPAAVQVRIERWFAPGVGMVRERRTAGGRTLDAVLVPGEGT